MASYWRYVKFNLADPAAGQRQRGWAIPWSADDLARRHWYTAVQSAVEPLDLTPADWLWLRQQEKDWWSVLERQSRQRPAVDFIYEDLFAGNRGDELRRLAFDRQLIVELRRIARSAGVYRTQRTAFWQAVFDDMRANDLHWPKVSQLVGRRVLAQPHSPSTDLSSLPPAWRDLLSIASERAAEERCIKEALAHWARATDWHQAERTVLVTPRLLRRWLKGWIELQSLLLEAKLGRVSPVRRSAWLAMKEFYWHELRRGLSEADLLVEGIITQSERAEFRQQISALRRTTTEAGVGVLQRDITLLSGRYRSPRANWHRQAVGRQWSQLAKRSITVKQASELTDEWGQQLLQDDWLIWSVVVDEEADSWRIEPAQHKVVIPTQPTHWTAADLLPIIAHELTHVWQSEQGRRASSRSLALWHQASPSTQPLAEAGAMRVERAVRHYLGGPDQLRQFYLSGLRARHRGASFGVVMAAVAEGLARQSGRLLARIPISERRDLARQAFRRSLRLYRPTLSLAASRRLLNEEQLKYVESALLADDLRQAGLEPLLSLNTVDLTRWPLYRRLGFDVATVEVFPLAQLIDIIKKTVTKLV